MTFNDFKFISKLAFAIKRAGFTEPSPIQAQAIPLVMEGHDMIGQAHTGTGKTAAFALPLLHMMDKKKNAQVVIIVPTRELATQVADETYRFSRYLDIRTATVFGGTSYKRQINHIENAGVIVATPGRFLDLLNRKKINIDPKYVVLDEADEMLNMGFLDDIQEIFTHFENREQTLMFSATMPEAIKYLAESILNEPKVIRVEQEAVTKNSIKQFCYVVDEHERDAAIIRLIEHTDPKKAIVFCRTKSETDRVADVLSAQGNNAKALHGDIEQWDRQKIMKGFRRNEYNILVATDVAARGIDVRDVTHVFNYHIPFESESYVHRIGRTGRAERDGIAMTIVTPHEMRELKRIQKDVGSELTLEGMPSKGLSKGDYVQHLNKLLTSNTIQEDTETLLKNLAKEYPMEHIAQHLLQHVLTQTEDDSILGKTKEQAETLLENADKRGAPKPRGGGRGRSRSSSSRSSSPRGGSRGGSRGGYQKREKIAAPTIKSSGSSRIVARKLY